jgi:ABC-type sugar transport system ATPase subunit
VNPISADEIPVIECRSITKHYGPLLAVDGVDLTVARGEVVGLVGKNGAGKSSLIKVLTGAVQPDSGALLMAGEQVSLRGPADSRRRGVGVVHQELNLVEQMSIAENIALGGGYPRAPWGAVRWSKVHSRAAELMETVDITDVDPRTKVSELTPVQKRQVMIAAALWHVPALLILDEPTASLSEHEVVILHGIVRRLRDRGTAVIYVSHRLDEVIVLTDRVVVMRDGAVVGGAPTAELDKPRLVGMITGAAVPSHERLTRRDVTGPPMLDVAEVTSARSPYPASFSVRAGEIVGVAGLVGSGRTELLDAVYGADGRTSGTVWVDGRTVAASPTASLQAGLAYLSEDRLHAGLVTGFSISRNITFASLRRFRAARGLPFPSRSKERSEAIARSAALSVKTASVDDPVMSLSGGNQQKVLMARWLAAQPKVLLLDEPTIGIDVEAKGEIYDLLRELADDGYALVVVSSEFTELELLCTRVIVMREGQFVTELEGDDVTEGNLLRHCFDADSAAA